jgi:hypothetical protein
MSTHYCRSHEEKSEIAEKILNFRGGVTVTINKGKTHKRSVDQNRLQRLWMDEAEQQGDMRAEEYRGYCKLHFGVPIMCEIPEYEESYNRVFSTLSYEKKLELMMKPLDYPVTRMMTTGQKKRYLDDVWMHFTSLGMKLTKPKSEDYELGSNEQW